MDLARWLAREAVQFVVGHALKECLGYIDAAQNPIAVASSLTGDRAL